MIRYRLTPGVAIPTPDATVTPVSRAVSLGRAGSPFHLEWVAPSRVLVTRGQRRSALPVVDLTRLAQLSILAAGLAGAIAILRRSRRIHKESNDE